MDPAATESTTEQTAATDTQAADDQELQRKQIEDGFEGKPTATPAADESTQTAAAQPEYAQITKEEWDALKARAAEVESLRATLEKSNGTAFGKIGGIERKLSELSAPTAAPVFDISDDEITGLQDDFPQLASVLKKLKSARPAQVDTDSIFEQAVERARRVAREELLAEVHSDWREVTDSEDFAAFAKSKGDDYLARLAQASAKWDHKTIGGAISEFKDERSKAQAKAAAVKNSADSLAAARRERRDAAVAPRGTAAPAQAQLSDAEEITGAFNRVRNGR